MTERQTSALIRHEISPQVDPPGSAEELALAALQRHLEVDQPADEIIPILDDEIATRDAQRLTTNSRHGADFFKTRFSYTQRYDTNGRRVFAYPRAQVEAYLSAYKAAEPLPAGYQGRTVSSFVSDAHPITAVFAVINELELAVRFFVLANKQRGEFIDEEDAELLELGLSERPAEDMSDDADWQPASAYDQLQSTTVHDRSRRFGSVAASEPWEDTTIRVVPSESRPFPPAWLHKATAPDAPAWQPRYMDGLTILERESIPLSQTGYAQHGQNALIALAAHYPELAADSAAIGLNNQGEPAVAAEWYERLVGWLDQCDVHGLAVPDSWQTLEDVARDGNVTLTGEEGLEAWVDGGFYSPDHVVTIPYRNGRNLRRLTFCSPQLARMIIDRITLERRRLERSIELSEKYGLTETEIIAKLPTDYPPEETANPKEELRARLQSLETFGAMRAIDPGWTYELIDASEHDAYVVDYKTDDGPRYAYFGTTEGIEYVVQNIAPADYRTARQICDSYGLPLYLFEEYADGIEAADEFLSAEAGANTSLMPHYCPDQVTHILRNYYDDVADEPMQVADIAARTGQTHHIVRDYLERHGVVINENFSVLRRAGLKYVNEHADMPEADDTFTPTLFAMRTREARNSDLSHTGVTAMCYELGIPITVRKNTAMRRITQHIPSDRMPELQAATHRYYDRYVRRNS